MYAIAAVFCRFWVPVDSDCNAFEVKDFGGIAEETATEFDNALGDSLEVSNLGLLEGRNQLPQSIVKVLLLIPHQVFRAAELQNDEIIWQVKESQSAFEGCGRRA